MLTKTSTLIIVFVAGLLISNTVIAEPQPNESALPKSSSAITSEANTSVIRTNQNDANTTPINRSQFTTAIVDREPTDNVVMLTNNSEKIYYFTELSNLKGQKITHRWEYQGKAMAEITFNVKSDRWRVFSSKKIKPEWTGEWSVVLLDENGKPLDVSKLEVVETTSN